jgi:hypothetical protein
MNIAIIELEDYIKDDKNVLVGKLLGDNIRRISDIDFIINEFDRVDIIIPKHILSLSPSFLSTLIKVSYNRLGRDTFNKKVYFTGNTKAIYNTLSESMNRLDTKNIIKVSNQKLESKLTSKAKKSTLFQTLLKKISKKF